MVIDHKNGNGLDNRKSNLRYCRQRFNIINRKIGKHNKSGHKGVSFNKLSNCWESYININNKRIHLGNHKNKEDAIKTRIAGEIKYHGEFRYGKR